MKQKTHSHISPSSTKRPKNAFFQRKPSDKTVFFQPKLTVGPTDDVYEKEADAVAEKVMRMENQGVVQPKLAISSVQRTCAECAQEDEKEVQRKSSGASQTEVPSVVRDVVSSGGGTKMSDGSRSTMENNFGYDFSNVRIHTGTIATKSAQSINALAYTSGNNIVFNQGQYSPETNSGKKLLAHELTHVIQQKAADKVINRKSEEENLQSEQTIPTTQHTGPVYTTKGPDSIQRAIKVDPAVDLDTMGFHVVRTGDTYTSNVVTKDSVWNEIISSLFFSPRTFRVKGSTSGEANRNFRAHLKARYDIITFAAKRAYRFGAGAAFRINSDFWVINPVTNEVEVKPGVNPQKAREDLNANPDQYVIACEVATKITMLGGSKSDKLRGDYGNAEDEWIPGDWGWIKNTNFPTTGGIPGREGENLIYVGQDIYWGHTTDKNAYKTFEQWLELVNSWNNNGAQLQDWRNYPTNGLV
jgi:hypothetical protein